MKRLPPSIVAVVVLAACGDGSKPTIRTSTKIETDPIRANTTTEVETEPAGANSITRIEGRWSFGISKAEIAHENGASVVVTCANGEPAVVTTFAAGEAAGGGQLRFAFDGKDNWHSVNPAVRVDGDSTLYTVVGDFLPKQIRTQNQITVRKGDSTIHASLSGSSAAVGQLACASRLRPTRVARKTTPSPRPSIRTVCDIGRVYPRAFAVKSWIVGGWYFDPGDGGKPLRQDPSEMLQIVMNQTGQRRLSIQTVALLAGC